MRIISGHFKGQRLSPPKNIKARPTTDMAREALFNMLTSELDISEYNILDLFAGTGAISLEFVSRGVKRVTAIDIEHISTKFISHVIRDWEIDNLRIVRADVLKLATKANETFDIVFADPPYGHRRFKEIPQLILDSGWLEKGGLLIVEHSDENNFEKHPEFTQHRRYGAVNFSFFRRQSE